MSADYPFMGVPRSIAHLEIVAPAASQCVVFWPDPRNDQRWIKKSH